MSDETFISRWSKRKSAVKAEQRATPQPRGPEAPPALVPEAAVPAASPPRLPDVESLTPESDFTPFMQGKVAEHLKRRALKTLFQDPRFNDMDGLDVYIDDFSKPDPLPEGWLEKMNQVARLGEYREPEPEAQEVPVEEPREATQAAGEIASTPDAAALEPPPPADTVEVAPPPAEVNES